MLLSSFRRWMNTRTFSFPRDSQRNTKYDKRRIRLRLEVLEDRCLPSGYNFTTVDVPGSMQTVAIGINGSRHVVGSYIDAGGGSHGYLLSGGSYTTLDVPGSISTNAFGINDSDQVVGRYIDAGGGSHGYLLSGGSYTTLDVPG